jgi:acyl-coenzyme A thioesterase PaaI-like protein
MSEREIALDPPPGYMESNPRGAFSLHNGPFFFKREGEDFRLGFRVLHRHCNSYGVVHGGMVMTFADRLLATAVALKAPQRMLTVRMTTDFIGMARAGDWVDWKVTRFRRRYR